MNKVVRNGEVAVLYSPGFGAGWYTWNVGHPGLLYDPVVVEWVEADKPSDDARRLEAYLEEKYLDCYLGGMHSLDIRWVPVGSRFVVDEYDGSESVVVDQEFDWMVA